MTSEEIQTLTRLLNQTLAERGFGWIVEEVSGVLVDGVEEKKSITFQQFSIYGDASPKRGPKSEVTSTRPYTETEQLDKLLEAVKNVLVDGNQIQHDIFHNLHNSTGVFKIAFEPDIPANIEERGFVRLPQNQERAFSLSESDLIPSEITLKLSKIIRQIREDIHASK